MRAHQCAAGAAHGSAEEEALGRSRGGFTTKTHVLTNALGYPLEIVLTDGQESDVGQADTVLELTLQGAEALGADKAYDSDRFLEAIRARGMVAVIPSRANRIAKRECDWFTYAERHVIE